MAKRVRWEVAEYQGDRRIRGKEEKRGQTTRRWGE
jgi:hypothetical protein